MAIARIKAWAASHREDLCVFGAFLALSCLHGHRVVADFGTHIAGHGGDGFQNLWNMWWFRESLLSGQNPYFTPMLHHPHGVTLLYQTLNPFNCLMALPFMELFGQPAAYNIVFLLSFAASGFGMYLLARRIFGDSLAAFAAGYAFTFSHFHLAHAQGHMQFVGLEWVPLSLLFFERLIETRRLHDGLLLGLSLALTTFCDIYLLVATVILLFIRAVAVAMALRKKALDPRLLGSLGAGALLYLATGGILVLAMLLSPTRAELMPAHDSRFWSADLQGFFVPGWISAWNEAFATISSRWTGNSAECSTYLGWSILVLAALAFAHPPARGRPWVWLSGMLAGMVLALGPALHWGGRIDDSVALPFAWIEKALPFFSLSGAPVRWHFVAMTASCLLLAAGIAGIRRRLPERRLWRLPLRLASGVLLLLAVAADLLPRPIEAREIVPPEFIAELRREGAGYAVMDLGDGNDALLRQTFHGLPMIGGYVSRLPRRLHDFERRTSLLRALRGEALLPKDRVTAEARELRLRFVIAYHGHPAIRNFAAMGLRMRFSETWLEVWEIPLDDALQEAP